MRRDILRLFFQLLFKLLSDTQITGVENIPKEGAGILAANHLGIIDAPLVFIALPRRDVTALVGHTHRRNIVVRVLVNIIDGIWINRDEADTQAIRAALSVLASGALLGIAPEGTRSQDGTMNYGKTGVAYLADRGKVPVVPAAITGTYRGLWRLLRFERLHITLHFGKPFYLPPIPRRNREEALQLATDELMAHIAVMLPPELRGVYAGHPRVEELMQERAAGVDKDPVIWS